MYVTRNEDEEIISTSATIQYDGQEWIDDDDKEMKCYACSLSNGFIKNCPNGKTGKILKCCKTKQKQVIQGSWQAEVGAGFTHDNNTFDFDDVTLGIIGARLAYNESLDNPTTADLTFYNDDKIAVVFADKNAFKAFCIAFILARNTIDQKRVSLKAQIDACATKEEVESITW